MRVFCSYFDRNYLLRGLTLYRSLAACEQDFVLYVLALDDFTKACIDKLGLAGLQAVALPDLEAWDPRLKIAKNNRGVVEYYFTLSPLLPLYLFSQYAHLDLVTYLDADLYFYRSPAPLFAELGERSILITEHRYPPHLEKKSVYGRFNVQYQSFRRDTWGLACLERWRDQCIDWCYDRLEDGRYADQKYLDEWPERYGDRLVVSQNRAAGVAPWNWSRYPLEAHEGSLFIDGEPLMFYHFHGLKVFSPYFISNGLYDWGLMPWRYQRRIYGDYVRQLRRTRRWVQASAGLELPISDRFKRGGGLSIRDTGEIVRKAWSQGMFIF